MVVTTATITSLRCFADFSKNFWKTINHLKREYYMFIYKFYLQVVLVNSSSEEIFRAEAFY